MEQNVCIWCRLLLIVIARISKNFTRNACFCWNLHESLQWQGFGFYYQILLNLIPNPCNSRLKLHLCAIISSKNLSPNSTASYFAPFCDSNQSSHCKLNNIIWKKPRKIQWTWRLKSTAEKIVFNGTFRAVQETRNVNWIRKRENIIMQ